MERRRDKKGRFVAQAKAPAPDWRETEPPLPRSVRRAQIEHPDRWTEAKRECFLAVLAATCNVSKACLAVGMSTPGVYKLRDRDAAFRRGWRAAISQGYARLEIEMLERALIAEERVRGALIEAESDRDALDLLGRHPSRTAELLYRVHRQTALEHDGAADDDPDGEKALAEIRERVEKLRERLLAGATLQ